MTEATQAIATAETIVQVVRNHAQSTPAAMAFTFGDEVLSFCLLYTSRCV